MRLTRDQALRIARHAWPATDGLRSDFGTETWPDVCPEGRAKCGMQFPVYIAGERGIYVCRTHEVAWTRGWAGVTYSPESALIAQLAEVGLLQGDDVLDPQEVPA